MVVDANCEETGGGREIEDALRHIIRRTVADDVSVANHVSVCSIVVVTPSHHEPHSSAGGGQVTGANRLIDRPAVEVRIDLSIALYLGHHPRGAHSGTGPSRTNQPTNATVNYET